MYLFSLLVYIGDFKMAKFIHPKPGCISKSEEKAVFEESWSSKDVFAFLFGEDCWERLGMFDGRHLKCPVVETEESVPVPQAKDGLFEEADREVIMDGEAIEV